SILTCARAGEKEDSRKLRAVIARSTSSSLRRPPIRLGAGAAHQHRPFSVSQAVGLAEGLDGLLVVDDRESAGPVGAPQAALEAPGVEQTRERIPDVREGIRLLRQRACAAHF